MSGKLVIIRHGESEYNQKGLWTGWIDISLSDKGKADAVKIGEKLTDIPFDHIYTSDLKRSHETLTALQTTLKQPDVPVTAAPELKERNYGDYAGLDKWQVKNDVGEEKYNAIRRGFREPIPNGETLSDVYDRVIPYYKAHILPELLAGKNILIVAHGNSDRALIKYLEKISDEGIANFEMTFDKIYIYSVDDEGYALSKDVRSIEIAKSEKA